jgi:hypothetical protein
MAFEDFNANKTTTKKKGKMRPKTGDSDDSEDEDFSAKSKSIANKVTKKGPTSTKRKRGLEED